MPTLQVPGLNVQLPLEEVAEGLPLAQAPPAEVEAAARDALLQWLGGMAEVVQGSRWDAGGRAWRGTIRYLGEEYEWLIR